MEPLGIRAVTADEINVTKLGTNRNRLISHIEEETQAGCGKLKRSVLGHKTKEVVGRDCHRYII